MHNERTALSYSSSSYIFKKAEGITPKQFRLLTICN